jgi:hypothetical protein
MARTWLRGVAWAIIWFSIPTSVGANGRVDDARQLFLSDITDAYNESVEYLEANNTTAGAEALQRLLELVSRLDRLWDGFGNDAKALLSASLFEEWGNVYNEIDQLYTETLNLKDKVGREQFSSDNLETRYDRTGSALEEFNEGMQEFGKKLGAMMSGPVENAHQLYANAITDAYEDTVDYLEANNTNDGAGAAGNLHQLANKLGELLKCRLVFQALLWMIWREHSKMPAPSWKSPTPAWRISSRDSRRCATPVRDPLGDEGFSGSQGGLALGWGPTMAVQRPESWDPGITACLPPGLPVRGHRRPAEVRPWGQPGALVVTLGRICYGPPPGEVRRELTVGHPCEK